MASFVEAGLRSFPCSSFACAPYLRVKFTSDVLSLASASENEVGTLAARTLSTDTSGSVRLRSAQGTEPMVASEAITSGNPVYAAAGGKVAASGTILVGHAMTAAGANNDVIEVLRIGEASGAAAAGGTTATTFEVNSDSATPKIALTTQTGGTGDFTTTLKPEATLSGDNAIIVPEADGDVLCALALAQTLTNKTLTAPVIVQDHEAHTAGDTLTAAESGSVHTNTGAVGTITIVLPAATVGQYFDFHVGAAQEQRLDPNGAEKIGLPRTGVQGAAGKYLVADAVGEWVTLKCVIAGTWTPQGYFGTWTAEG